MNRARRNEGGVAAIEMTIMLGTSMMLLAALVLLGRLTWHTIVFEKSMASAARIVATLPPETLRAVGASGTVRTIAVAHVTAATLSAGLDVQPDASSVMVLCGVANGCGPANLNTMIWIQAQLPFEDTIFRDIFTYDFLTLPPALVADYTQSYVPTIPPLPVP